MSRVGQPLQACDIDAGGPIPDGMQVARCEFVEHGGCLCSEIGAAGKPLDHAGPATFERRQDVVAQVIAIETQVLIGRIVDPAQVLRRRIGFQRVAGYIDERPHQPARRERCHQADAGHAGRTAAPHQIEQQCLGLVVPVVGAEQPVPAAHVPCERRVARLACGGLESPDTGIDRDRLRNEFECERVGKLAAVIAPATGFGVQLVVDVHSQQRLAVALPRKR